MYSHKTTGALFVVFAEGARTVKVNLVYGLALHEVFAAQVIRAPARCLGGHRESNPATATLAILLSVIVCFDFVLFSLALASLRQTVFT